MCPGHWGAERTDTKTVWKDRVFQEGKVELGIESKFVYPMVKGEGRTLHSKQRKQHA